MLASSMLASSLLPACVRSLPFQACALPALWSPPLLWSPLVVPALETSVSVRAVAWAERLALALAE